MKKHLLLLLCCIAFVISGMAQPENKKIAEKFFKKNNLEKLHPKNHLEKEKTFFSQKSLFSSQKQRQAKSQKNTDWWEPDTVYGYYVNGSCERQIFSYKNGNCSVLSTQEKFNSQWVNVYRVLYNYDSQNNRIEELGQVWESGQWQNDFKVISTFDSQNNETSYVSQYWESGQWITFWKTSYIYDAQNNMIEEMDQSWESGTWMNLNKYLYSYNSFNNWTEVLFQSYEEEQWITVAKETFTYTAQNNWSEILLQIYEDEEWVNDALQTFTYNEQNQCTSYIFQSWAWDFGQWKNEDKVSLTHDTQNNTTSELWQSWWLGQWRNVGNSTWSYDENNNATSGNYQYWDNNAWGDEDGGLYVNYNNMQSCVFAEGYRFTATYIDPNDVSVTETELFNDVVKIYPNPVSNVLHIETGDLNLVPEVKLYSIQGVLLMNVKGSQIDVSSLPKGIYIVEINKVFQKIIKE